MSSVEKLPIPDEADPCPDYNPEPDADGFIPWITFGDAQFSNQQRLAALSALLAVTGFSFKLKYDEHKTSACLWVQKPNCRAVEVLWNLSGFVDVEAPPVLKINISKMVETKEGKLAFAVPPSEEPEADRFDEIT